MSNKKNGVFYYAVAKTNSVDGLVTDENVFHLYGLPWPAASDEQAKETMAQTLEEMSPYEKENTNLDEFCLYRLFEYRGAEKYPIKKDFALIGVVSALVQKKGTEDGE